MQKLSDLRKSLHNDHEAAMYELLEKLDIKSKKLKKFENQMCSLEELDGLKETEKSHKRLMQSHENIIKVFYENVPTGSFIGRTLNGWSYHNLRKITD